MMQVFRIPSPSPVDRRVVGLIDELRQQLRFRVAEPRRWGGRLRRMAFARAVQASNSIEGYNASLDDVVAAVEGEPALDATTETELALAGYRDAMTYMLQASRDSTVVIDEGMLKALHFMMIKHDLAKNPGQWRPGGIFVQRGDTGDVVYEGPDAELIPTLIPAMLAELEGTAAPVLVRAAVAHLNLAMIHPFSDGNGRMARALQTLVLARDQIVAPVFSSIEEYLGRNTQAYYDILAEVGEGRWNPQHDATPWVRFCLTAHYRQAQTHLRRMEEADEVWSACVELTVARRLPERCAGALYDASFGLRIRNPGYRELVEQTMGVEISSLTASRDLNAMVEAGLLAPLGEGRGRYYLGRESVVEVRERVRAKRSSRSDEDPFAIASDQLKLPVG